MGGLKEIVLAAFTLCVGGLLLYSGSGVGIALGLTLITLTSIAVVSRFGFKRASRPRA